MVDILAVVGALSLGLWGIGYIIYQTKKDEK